MFPDNQQSSEAKKKALTVGIAQYIKEIGRGPRGAKPLTRAQATDLFGQVLDGTVTDLEIGAFCLAMRIKGETSEEMAGFLDATHARLNRIPATQRPLIVLPSYNGARKLPVLTPLLALLLAREGLPVLVHGTQTESRRITASSVLETLGIPTMAAVQPITDGTVAHLDTGVLHTGLKRLLEVRQTVGLRNPGHSVVKLMQPGVGTQIVVSSYTHPEYFSMICDTFATLQMQAVLTRGLEGEVVSDPRRTPQIHGFVNGEHTELATQQPGTLSDVPGLPTEIDAATPPASPRPAPAGDAPVPESIARQVHHITTIAARL